MLHAALVLALALTPMTPGFHQSLACNQGSVAIEVADAHPADMPHAVLVTTTLRTPTTRSKTFALRESDAAGNIYARGYLAGGVLKRFPKRLLLPASPPAPGSVTSYYTIAGVLVHKRFTGRRAGGFAFADFVDGHQLNSVTYVPLTGIVEARFLGMLPGGGDLVCRLAAPAASTL